MNTRIKAGQIVIIERGSTRRVCAVTHVDGEMIRAHLCDPHTDLATDFDLIIDPQPPLQPDELVVRAELYFTTTADQVVARCGTLTGSELDALIWSLFTDAKSLNGHRTGRPLTSDPGDTRRAYIISQLDDIDALTGADQSTETSAWTG